MVTVLDAIDDGSEFAMHPAVETRAEDFRDLVGSEAPQAKLAAAVEQLVDGEVTFEDPVAAIFDLRDGVKARQVEQLTLFGGELRAQDEGPVVEALADDL